MTGFHKPASTALDPLLQRFMHIDFKSMRPKGFNTVIGADIRQCCDRVDRGRGWRRIESCPNCGSKESRTLLTRFGRGLKQCSNCTLGYMEHFPVSTADLIGETDYAYLQEKAYLRNAEYRKERFGKERLELIEQFLPVDPRNATLLDVGCGTGWFLESAIERGYTVEGVEFARELARITSERIDVPITSMPLDEFKGSDRFDVITMFDVLEHVENPQEVLGSIHRLLKPGGVGMIFVPNLESLGNYVLGANSNLIMPAEHLFQFTRKSLSMMLSKASLEILKFSTNGMDIADIAAYMRDEAEKPEVFEFLVDNVDILQAIVDSSGFANHMRFIVRKDQSPPRLAGS